MLRLAIFAACIGLCGSPALAQDKAAIQKLDDAWAAAFNKGDAAALAAMYTADAVALPPGAEMAKGRREIEALWGQAAQGLGDAKLTAVDVMPLSPTAVAEIGAFSLRTKAPSAEEVTGKYVVIWQNVGGAWQLAVDIWNTNK